MSAKLRLCIPAEPEPEDAYAEALRDQPDPMFSPVAYAEWRAKWERAAKEVPSEK